MFKITGRGGLRRTGGGAQSAAGRISGLHGLRGSDTAVSRRRRPAFMPDTPEQQATDGSASSRVDNVGESKSGYSGSNIGA